MGCRASPPVERSGTERMADTLAVLYSAAVRSPEPYIFLNRVRADSLEARLPGLSGTEALGTRFLLAQERLRGGQAREAIAQLDTLFRRAGIPADGITATNKPLFDLFAVAWLRLGEQDNCLDNPGAGVCILPLAGAGRHTREEGARGAVARYSTLLAKFPEDYGSRWLLNIAWMALGGYPDSVPARYRIPGLRPPVRPRFPLFPNIAAELGVAVNGRAGGLSVEDLNGDGLLDLFTTSQGLTDPVHLYLADGRGGFADRSAAAGLDGIVGGLNVVHADYDNDGDVDLFILRGAWLHDAGAWPNSLLRNRGDATFEDVTFHSGLLSFHPTQTAAWGDFNLDGHLDLFVGNEADRRADRVVHRSELFQNRGDGTFAEVSAEVGIDLADYVKGVAWGDVNNDGLPDLFASVLGGPNRLYVNRGRAPSGSWRFEETARSAGVERPIFGFPTWFWDYDQDGREDLLVLGYDLRFGAAVHDAAAREYLGLPLTTDYEGTKVAFEPSRLYRNKGDGTFADVTGAAGLETKMLYAMGSNFGDLDNDGWLDFYAGTGNPDLRSVVPNRMFRNDGARRFTEVTLEGGFGHIQKGHGTAFADLDRDGDEDIYMVIGGAYQGDRFSAALFENPGWPGRSWIALELVGRAANRSAIGARVEVVVAGSSGTRSLHRTVGSGGSFGAGPLALHVGLGTASRVERVTVSWPDSARTRTTYSGLAVNRSYRIVQGEQPVGLERAAVPFRKSPAVHSTHSERTPER
ncbi:MAG: CRTAC1 family protein [Gemmatimonadales bacterium]